MLLSVRQLLNETDDDDVDTISLLTSLVLAVAESLQRMRRAAQRALAAYAESRPRDPASVSRGRRVMAPEDVDERAVVPYSGSTGSSTALSDSNDYRLTLVALESCDAAYRQIQVWSIAHRKSQNPLRWLVRSWFGAGSELASVMEFGFKLPYWCH